MIQDALANAGRYHALHPLFAPAFAWCADPTNLASVDGRIPIRGEDLFVIVDSGATAPAADKRLESHRRYIDIQVNLTGPEVMEWCPVADLRPADDFAPDGDIRFYHQPAFTPTRLLVRPREFAVFWPEDAHKPCCNPDGGSARFRKLVFKVAASAR